MTDDAMEEWMGMLTPRLRRTCRLAWAEQRPLIEIGAIQGISPRTVETRLDRARRRLRAAGIIPPDRRRLARRSKVLQLGMSLNV
jgi:DNA-directed RNA polymerase specialized sigma24 family protein